MKIVITDGYTLNPGDLSWQPFHELGEVTYYDRTKPEELVARCREANIIVTNKTPIQEPVMLTAPGLKLIAVTATGYNVVDTAAARKHGISVCNVPEYGTHSVAQHTFALLLELTNHVGRHAQSVREGEWVRAIDWSYARAPIIELRDKTLGIVGLGRIGNQAAAIARAFGMNVIYHRGRAEKAQAAAVGLEALFSTSDFVSLHCPLKPENQEFVNKALLSHMKPSAYLINTSRGQLIHEPDLAEALKRGVLAGAALDVLSKEPPPPDHPLLGLSNCLITPHNAWLSFEARQRILQITLGNVKAALGGKPQNVVN
ncbi:D-2-hydroxyacid dehydrogenase [Fulvivirgaceae bacterium PWU4]|uniref:D-2-hydroxyacid dehydrogenase n=1 Tax=Chryseosolibacter histidini TaxID=2782349 RepID=A0AAP2DRW9_9BACT|nr:D-2-hydroxyacid dehydrogenase [Chryseosolibacter histidini]MBT1701431.1 D-2-hydroxyacid dehydrogenase [Chryseosolibacter histidini]